MTTMSRSHAIALLGGAALLPAACAAPANSAVRVGSKNFTEELILGELYALALERAGVRVERKLNLGSVEIAMGALLRGDIDLYPEYTGTALITQLKMAPMSDRARVFATVKSAYERRYRLTWLRPAPMNDTQALAVTRATSARYRLTTLSQCSRLAPHLRLGAIHEFVERADGLPGLQKAYGGFRFADVKLTAIGLKYRALLAGEVDVAVAFSTDGEIDAHDLVVLDDDLHFFPPYQVAPVVRLDALQRFPGLVAALDPLAPLITDAAMRRLNRRVDGDHQEPADVARDFLSHGLGPSAAP